MMAVATTHKCGLARTDPPSHVRHTRVGEHQNTIRISTPVILSPTLRPLFRFPQACLILAAQSRREGKGIPGEEHPVA